MPQRSIKITNRKLLCVRRPWLKSSFRHKKAQEARIIFLSCCACLWLVGLLRQSRVKTSSVAAVFALMMLCACRSGKGTNVVPTIALDSAFSANEFHIDEWQVSGPFRSDGTGASAAETDLDKDFTISFGQTEAGMNAANFGQLNKGLINRFYLPADFKNTRAHLDNDAIRFDKLFQTTKNTVAYAACVIESPQDRELVMVSGADDGMKVWLNGKMLLKTRLNEAPSGNPSYGDLGKSRYFTSLPLLKGGNFLLVKVSPLDRMWGFNCTLLTLEEARKRSQENQLYLRDRSEERILR